MLKKIVVVLFLAFAISIILLPKERSLFAQEIISADDLKKLSSITGLSVAQIGNYAFTSVDVVLQVYSAASVSGNSFAVVYENSDKGLLLSKYYTKYSVSVFAQTTATEKFNKLKAKMGKVVQAASDTYAGIDKKVVADVISRKTGVSSSSIMDYGFGSGISVGDILACCVIASKSGNSLSTVIEKRKQAGNIPEVYKAMAILPAKENEIAGIITSYSEEVNAAGKSGAVQAVGEVSEVMKKEAKILAGITGSSEAAIIELMSKGDNTVDIVRAIAIARKIGGRFTTVLEMKRTGGWPKVTSYYAIGNSDAQDNINKTITSINEKLKPQ